MPENAVTLQSRAGSLRWLAPPDSVTLAPRHVHIWRVKASRSNYAFLKSHVSAADCAHAQRFALMVNRYEFLVSRGLLRFLLGCYLGMPPGALRFRSGQHGKPGLEYGLCGGRRLKFNVSHSGGLILIAIALDHEVGIDIEYVSPTVDFTGFASSIFSSAERNWLLQSPPVQRQLHFFRCWARKEALAKGLGEGISDRIRLLEIIPSQAQLLPLISGVPAGRDWTIKDLDVGDNFVGAIAVGHDKCSLRLWDWPAIAGNLQPTTLVAQEERVQLQRG